MLLAPKTPRLRRCRNLNAILDEEVQSAFAIGDYMGIKVESEVRNIIVIGTKQTGRTKIEMSRRNENKKGHNS